MTTAEKVQKASVVSAIEQAGGFVIDKQEDAPLQAEEMVNKAVKENLAARKNPINILEKEVESQKFPVKSHALDRYRGAGYTRLGT